jgi:hypothetical protein
MDASGDRSNTPVRALAGNELAGALEVAGTARRRELGPGSIDGVCGCEPVGIAAVLGEPAGTGTTGAGAGVTAEVGEAVWVAGAAAWEAGAAAT